MKKYILMFVLMFSLGFFMFTTNDPVVIDNNNVELVDFEDSGEPEYVFFLDFEDSGEPEYVFFLDFEDSGEPEYVFFLDFADSGEPEFISSGGGSHL